MSDEKFFRKMFPYRQAVNSEIVVSAGTPDIFEKELFELINRHIDSGLSKPDLVKKMKWATGNCEFS